MHGSKIVPMVVVMLFALKKTLWYFVLYSLGHIDPF